MRNVTYRDRQGQEHPALIVGHTPLGEHLVFFEDEELHVRGPMKSSTKTLPHEDCWTSEGHTYDDKSILDSEHDDDDLYLEY
jgi:hypothetical protein